MSPALQKPSVISLSSLGRHLTSASRRASIPSPVVALRRITCLFVRMLICLAKASLSAMRSLCVSATIAGISLTLNSSKSLSSVSVPASVKSTTAISVLSSIRAVRAIRSLPNDVMSSRPGVSMIRAAPRPLISTAFCTGSVVVPAVADTIATS